MKTKINLVPKCVATGGVDSRDSSTINDDVTSKRQRAHRSGYGLDLISGADSVSAEEKDDKGNVYYVYEIDGL
nr:thylakoid lumenal 19 kDa protein, chloroplastic [Tanacetum cinerariifolium]